MPLIPLATMNPDIIKDTVDGYAAYRDILDKLNTRLTNDHEIKTRHMNSIASLTQELKEFKELSSDTEYRKKEIEMMIIELEKELEKINAKIKKTMEDIQSIESKSKSIRDKDYTKKIDDNLRKSSGIMFSLEKATKSRNVCKVYDVFFKDIISDTKDVMNSEYTTYTELWNSLLSRTDADYKQDHTQIVGILMKYISDNGIIKPEIFTDVYAKICDFYEMVLSKYGRDYKELMPYLGKDGESQYEQNYVLEQIFCIMVHIFKHTMSINFITTIGKLIARQNKGRTEQSIMRNIYESMKSSGFIEHCINIIPRQIIKITCKISSSNSDPDIALTNTDVLTNALNMMLSSQYDNIDKKSIDLAKEIVVPFFVTYMETYTAEMHLFMVKQIKSLIIQSKLLNILKLLAMKAEIESKDS
jgi:hypothetical protein